MENNNKNPETNENMNGYNDNNQNNSNNNYGCNGVNNYGYAQPIVQYANTVSKTVLVLSVVISLLVGAIGGYFVGEARYSKKLNQAEIYMNNTSSGNNQSSGEANNSTNNDSNAQGTVDNGVTIDYSQYKIGNSDFTIDTYYSDEESKMYASKIIGQEIPNIKWKDASGKEYSSDELQGEYILEFFMTTCVYCNEAIPEVDAFREAHPDTKVISLAFDTGDLSAFNEKGENAFYVQNLNTSAEVSEFTNNMPFVPAVVYVKDGVAQLLTFGGPTKTDMEDAMVVAFGE